MSRFVYSSEMVAFLSVGFKRWRVPELARQFNLKFGLDKSESSIKACLKNKGITCGRKVGLRSGERPLKYDAEQIEWLKLNYPILQLTDLVKAFNHVFELSESTSQVRAFLKNHNITSGRTGQFEKGSESWNKGKSFTAGGRSSETRFKKGSVPANRKPLGSERICAKDGYVYIKVSEKDPHTSAKTRYRLKHQVVWEKANGKIPPGKAIVFRDGDKLNCKLDNLILVSRGQLAVMNKSGLIHAPAEMKETAALTAELIIQTNAKAA